MAGFVILWGWIALGLRTYDDEFGVVPPSWCTALGIILMFLGGALLLACGLIFGAKGQGTPAVFDAPRHFVVVGPYRFVRNPMYIAGLILLVGFGFFQRSISMVLFVVPMFFLFQLFVVYVEEPGLLRRFGQPYLAYKERINRWIPKWK